MTSRENKASRYEKSWYNLEASRCTSLISISANKLLEQGQHTKHWLLPIRISFTSGQSVIIDGNEAGIRLAKSQGL